MPVACVTLEQELTAPRVTANARHGQFLHMRIGIVDTRYAVCTEGLHFSAFHFLSMPSKVYTPATLYISMYFAIKGTLYFALGTLELFQSCRIESTLPVTFPSQYSFPPTSHLVGGSAKSSPMESP